VPVDKLPGLGTVLILDMVLAKLAISLDETFNKTAVSQACSIVQ